MLIPGGGIMGKSVVMTCLMAMFCSQLALAQVSTGAISGVVRDATAAVVPGATVTMTNRDTGITRTTTTDNLGRYHAPNLPLGNYEIRAQLAGFQTEVR